MPPVKKPLRSKTFKYKNVKYLFELSTETSELHVEVFVFFPGHQPREKYEGKYQPQEYETYAYKKSGKDAQTMDEFIIELHTIAQKAIDDVNEFEARMNLPILELAAKAGK